MMISTIQKPVQRKRKNGQKFLKTLDKINGNNQVKYFKDIRSDLSLGGKLVIVDFKQGTCLWSRQTNIRSHLLQ